MRWKRSRRCWMRSRFLIEDFQPKGLEKANASLDKHFQAAKLHENTNEAYKKTVFKETFWDKLKKIFIKA